MHKGVNGVQVILKMRRDLNSYCTPCGQFSVVIFFPEGISKADDEDDDRP